VQRIGQFGGSLCGTSCTSLCGRLAHDLLAGEHYLISKFWPFPNNDLYIESNAFLSRSRTCLKA
jgi:hypothetical protein